MKKMTDIFKGDIKLNDSLQVKEYRLMYYFGCWLTAKKIYAEDDAEAIFDAQEHISTKRLRWALFCNGRMVAVLQEATEPVELAYNR